MTEAWVASRFVHFVATLAVFGIGAFRLYAFAGASGAAVEADEFDTLLARLMAAASLVALLSALAIVPFTAAEMTGENTAAFDPSVWVLVLTQTEFGGIWCWHIGIASVAAGLNLLPRRRWQPSAALLAALLLTASLGLTGHAAMDMGGGFTHAINQIAHLTAAGLWLGGLLPLGLLLRRAVGVDGAAYRPLACAALPHFSQIGYVAVGLLIITGTVNSVMLAGSFTGLATTAYGRLLSVKIALFTVMVGLALINRFRLLPRLRDATDANVPLRALLRSVVVEQALGLGILTVVAVLGTWPPAQMAM